MVIYRYVTQNSRKLCWIYFAMMMDDRDAGTVKMDSSIKRGRGRPTKPDALSNAERQRRWRTRRAEADRAAAVQRAMAVGSDRGLSIELAHTERLTEQLVDAGLEIGYWRSRANILLAERDALQAELARAQQDIESYRILLKLAG